MPDPNYHLRGARERTPSRDAPGECMSRRELSEAVNAWLWETTQKRYDMDGHYIAKVERGVVRWPSAAYRSGLRAVLGVTIDAELGFKPRGSVPQPSPAAPATAWSADTIAHRGAGLTHDDLVTVSRRHVLAGTMLVGSALTAELEPWLRPVIPSVGHGSGFTPPELDALEQIATQLRDWHSKTGVLARSAVVAQLNGLIGRLKDVPSGTTETTRAFSIAAQLADTAASMSWDAGFSSSAQQYFVLSVQLAKFAGDDTFAAVVLVDLARHCYDMNRPGDGLDMCQLAKYGTRKTATPRLKALLATREAWAYAQQGDVRAFQRTVGLAEDHHADGLQDDDAHTTAAKHLDDAELVGVIGARYRDLARHDPKHARRSQDYISRALVLRDPGKRRNRVFDLIGLARAHLITREHDRSAELIEEAAPLAVAWATGRVGAKLRDFHHESAPFEKMRPVRHAREIIAELINV